MTASVTLGHALRYAGGSARSLLHHHRGHCLAATVKSPEVSWRQLLQLIDVGAHLKSQRSLLPWSTTFRA